ncbi:GTPase HflX [Synechococcus sp. RSCCF101]|uniref:GTPase HflX n=1 Tax=Synechococcus sp. RSCCF101 TaxID=2511069 RepID=UPI0012494664|nr:GTPase HflX [Synechococcus sp. RSCCF101]QEY32957.1 GTPase HflX [Synechococcus sp. RSCCF101]
MKQGCLAGRVRGLRPSESRRLERLLHQRHPQIDGLSCGCLERLAELCRDLGTPLHLVIDGRGLSRLLWVGPLDRSGQLLERLPGSRRTEAQDWRMVSCLSAGAGADLSPRGGEGLVAHDLHPDHWLRFTATAAAGGGWRAALYTPDWSAGGGWQLHAEGQLLDLCDSGAWAAARGEPPAGAGRPPAGGTQPERVLLLTMASEDGTASARALAELEGLVRSAGGLPVGVVSQRQRQIHAQTLWGMGKLREAGLEARRLQASLVVTDRELTPVQCRNLERAVDRPVSDRSELILDIFAQRAGSAAGRLQVELAQLRYRLPRLQGRGQALSRQGGGIGTRGPGETQLERDRRVISRRIGRLQQQVRQLGEHRGRLRRQRQTCWRVALVGYTNAGKSSLLNALCATDPDRRIAARDRLFETLDPTTRRLPAASADGVSILVTDTVGFIRDLPPDLIEAFRSTLEEALAADLLLLVVNLADPAWSDQLRAVHEVLDQLGSTVPRRVVANQIDRCPAPALDEAAALTPPPLFVSATCGDGLKRLRRHLEEHAAAPTVRR